MDQLGRDILTKLIECILQSRVNIQKKQIRHFDQINKQILQERYKQQQTHKNISDFLKSLLLCQKHAIKQLLIKAKTYQIISIEFKLVHKDKKEEITAQVWLIQFQQFKDKQVQDDDFHEPQQIYLTICTLFEQLLLFLNKQPLFSQYQRNPTMKNTYNLDYKLRMHQNTKYLGQICCITGINHKHTKQRLCHTFLVKIECYYLDTLHEIGSTNSSLQNNELKKKELVPTDYSEKSDSVNQKTRKYSVYEFYDKDLDFVFLSSDDETFKKSPKGQIKQINIAGYIDDSQQFQLLVVSKDDQFIDENKANFSQLSLNQKNYLKN